MVQNEWYCVILHVLQNRKLLKFCLVSFRETEEQLEFRFVSCIFCIKLILYKFTKQTKMLLAGAH
jgi:hypothetical protein